MSREAELTAAVLGGAEDFLAALGGEAGEDEKEEAKTSASEDEAPEEFTAKRRPLWVDEDDDVAVRLKRSNRLERLGRSGDGKEVPAAEYSARLRKELERTKGPTPAWARLKPGAKKPRSAFRAESDSSEEEEEELTRRTGAWLATSTEHLPKESLAYTRLKDATFGHRIKKSPLVAVAFHPSAPILLVASKAGKAQLFRLNSKGESELMSSVSFDNFPITAAAWAGPGAFAVASSRANFVHVYSLERERSAKLFVDGPRSVGLKVSDLVATSDGAFIGVLCGDGVIALLDAAGFGRLGELRHNGQVLAASSPRDAPTRLFSTGSEGLVYVWDLGQRHCIAKFADSGCLQGSALAVSLDGSLLAVGSTSGIVNVYDVATALKASEPRPRLVLNNLTTAATSLAFNHSSELLLFASDRKDGAARLVHIASGKVYDSWPGRRAKLRQVTSATFSADSGLLSLGNEAGQAALYRLQHFHAKALATKQGDHSDSE